MIEDLLIDFDEMGFAPVPICGINPEEYARKWKSELVSEIERLQEDYSKLQELFAQYQMASDKEIIAQKKEAEKRFENNMKSVLEIEKKQAKIDVLNALKNKSYVNDYCREVVEVEKIDEMIKELIK